MTRKPIRDLGSKSETPVATFKAPVAKSTKTANPLAERRRSRQPQGPNTPAGEDRTVSLMLAVIERAVDMGLMTAETRQVGARLPVELLQRAKKRTGIGSTTALLEFALANLAVEDDFATAFVAARGQLDPDVDVGF